MEAGYHGRGGSLRSFSLSRFSFLCHRREKRSAQLWISYIGERKIFLFFLLLHFQAHQVSSLKEERERERDRLKIITRHFENSRLFFPIVNWRESGQRRHGDRMKLTHHLLSTAFYPSRFPTRRDTPLSLFFLVRT